MSRVASWTVEGGRQKSSVAEENEGYRFLGCIERQLCEVRHEWDSCKGSSGEGPMKWSSLDASRRMVNLAMLDMDWIYARGVQ
jgi:hypothetical protein